MSTPTMRSISFGTVESPGCHHHGAPRCCIVLLPLPRRQYRSRFTESPNITPHRLCSGQRYKSRRIEQGTRDTGHGTDGQGTRDTGQTDTGQTDTGQTDTGQTDTGHGTPDADELKFDKNAIQKIMKYH